MVRVDFQVTDRLPYLFEKRGMLCRIFERRELPICSKRKLNLSAHHYDFACLANEPR